MASILRSTADRAVHLKITPRPSNVGESREILRLISQFGEVEYFKNFKYDALPAPNTTIVVFKDTDAAAHCLRRTPIRFRMGKAPAGEVPNSIGATWDQTPAVNEPIERATPTQPPSDAMRGSAGGYAPFGLGQTRSFSTQTLPDALSIHTLPDALSAETLPDAPARPIRMPFEAPPQPSLESRLFQIQGNPARVHLRNQINQGRYHGSFPMDTKSIAHLDLAGSVPVSGLSCVNWRAPQPPWRLVFQAKEREHTGPERRKSLRELYDEGAKEARKSIMER